MNRANLLKLARYLAGDVIEFRFDMRRYQNDCGTAACAVGHGPSAGIVDTHGDLKWVYDGRKRKCGWMDYARNQFQLTEIEDWWCFGGGWCERDNTAIGAAKRIFWMLKYGCPAEPLKYMSGIYPLCYCDMDITEFMEPEFEKAVVSK